jgi:uncharacterized protein (TIGR02678 family)
MTSLTDTLAAAQADEQRRAARALLSHPVLRARGKHAESFVLVRRHAAELRSWFDRNTGWSLIIDSEVARLLKSAVTTDDHTHPARDPRSGAPFSRRRYVLACLALAALERSDAQITLGRLAEAIMLGAADPDLADAGIDFALDTREQRTDLVSVVRLLLDVGVLAHVAGDADAFVKDVGDALYDVDRRVLSSLLVTPRGPSTIQGADFDDRLRRLVTGLAPLTDELRNQQIRQQLTRRLLDRPVLYYDELDEPELAYLTSQRHAITSRIAGLTGLVPEIRAEGIAMVDPFDDLTDVRMPESGTDGHATLLIAEHLAGRYPDRVSTADLVEHTRQMALEHRAYWRRGVQEPGAELELTEHALDRLEALGLIRHEGDLIRSRPALLRYALAPATITERS